MRCLRCARMGSPKQSGRVSGGRIAVAWRASFEQSVAMTSLPRFEPAWPPLKPWTWTGLYMGYGGYCLVMAMIATAQTAHFALITAMVGLVALSFWAPLDGRTSRASGGLAHDLLRRACALAPLRSSPCSGASRMRPARSAAWPRLDDQIGCGIAPAGGNWTLLRTDTKSHLSC